MLKRLLCLTLVASLLCGSASAIASLDGELPDEIETGEGYQNIRPLALVIAPSAAVDAEELHTYGVTVAGDCTVADLGYGIYRITDATEDNPAGVHVDEEGAYAGFNYATDVYLILGEDKYLLYGCAHTSPYLLPDLSPLVGGRELVAANDYRVGETEKIDLGGREITLFGLNGGYVAVDSETEAVFAGDFIGCGDGVEADDLTVLWDNLDAFSSFIYSSYDSPVVYTAHSWQTPADFVFDTGYLAEIGGLLTDAANGKYEALYTTHYNPAYDLCIGEGIASIITTRRAALRFTLEMGGVPPSPFADVPGDHPYAVPVAWCYAEGLTNGKAMDTYDPEAGLTRAEFMTFLGRAAGAENDVTKNGGFDDVPAGEWFSGYIAWGVEFALIQGVGAKAGIGNNCFDLNGVLTRNHVNIIVNDRYAPKLGLDVTELYTDGLNQPATRAEIAAILYLLFADAE